MKNKVTFACIIMTSLMALAGARAEVEAVPGRWSVEKAQEWYQAQPWLVGCNYLPATAINQLEMWQADSFDPKTIETELKWAEDLGFNTLRVYLHDLVWEQDTKGFYKRMDQFLELCDKRGMSVLFVFFDDCHRPDSKIGKQPLPVPEYHNSGWVKSPSTEVMVRYHKGKATQSEVKRLRGYVQKTMERFKNDSRVLAWELYNEPGRSAGDKSAALLQDAWRWAREVAPSQPICSTAEGSVGEIFFEIARVNSDVISFHCYDDKKLEEIIALYEKTGRPALCTEYMARPTSTFEDALPILKKHHIAAYNWGFVSGKFGTVWPWSSRDGKDIYKLREEGQLIQPGEAYPEPKVWFHDIYRVDGTPYSQDEIDFIKRTITQ